MNTQIRRYWALLAPHVAPLKTRFALLAVLLLGSIGLQLASPQIVRAFIDQVTSSREGQALLGAALDASHQVLICRPVFIDHRRALRLAVIN